MSNSSGRRHVRQILDAALAAVRPEFLVVEALRLASVADRIDSAEHIIVVGAGKAAAGMVAGLEAGLATRLTSVTGVVNVPDDLVRPTKAVRLQAARPRGVNEPTPAAAQGVDRMLELIAVARANDLIITLISGGGSALLPAPVSGVSLADKIAVTRLMSERGASIADLNCVRKHLSLVKGGGLARLAPCPLTSLIISDVVGDPLDVIASGPTAPDSTTFADALAVLARFDPPALIPPSVAHHLARGAAGDAPETLKKLPQHVSNHVIGNNARALAAAVGESRRLGYTVTSLGDSVTGELSAVARTFAERIRSLGAGKHCILAGGETTVSLPPAHGLGGRNQEFVLALLSELGSGEMPGITILSAGTDGEDGPTDAAGAIADTNTLVRAAVAQVSPAEFLERHDSYRFFTATGDLLITGLTGTNVMDIQCVLIDREKAAPQVRL